MKKAKRIIALLLIAIMLLSTPAFAVNKVENGKDVLVTIETDKTSYSAKDTAVVTIKVENKTRQILTGVVICADTDNWRLEKGSASNVLEVGKLARGEKTEMTFKAVLNRNADGIGFFQKIVLFFRQLFKKPSQFKSYTANDKNSTEETTTIDHGGAKVTVTATAWYAPVKEDEYELVEFGSYPQSEVANKTLVSELNSLALEWKSYGYYSGTGYTGDGKMVAGDYMKFADVSYGGSKYRAVRFTEYRPYLTGKSKSAVNSRQYENSYGPDTTYWFKYEPIEWRKLGSTGLLMCETLIDSQPFSNYVLEKNDGERFNNKGSYSTNWKDSSIRAWLNDDFYNTAFSSSEKAKIKTSTNSNKCMGSIYYENESLKKYNCEDTSDKVFLLSWADVQNGAYGFSSDGKLCDAARVAVGSDYAKCQGLYYVKSYEETDENKVGCSSWWVRTPVDSSYWQCCVSTGGHANSETYFSAGYTSAGVRPAIVLYP